MSRTKLVSLRGIRPPPEAREMLVDLLRRLRLKRRAETLFGQHPSLESASQRLVWLVSPGLVYPYGRKTVIEHCLVRALAPVEHARADACRGFIQGLLVNLSMLMELRVADAGAVWNPLTDEPLTTWLRKRPAATVELAAIHEGVSLRKFITSIAMRVLDATDYHYVTGSEGAEP